MRVRYAALGLGALALLLAGCSSAPAGPVGAWGHDEPGKPRLVLEEGGRLHGTDGCNRIMGSWTSDGRTIEFGPIASTLMFCSDVDTWLLEAKSAKINEPALILYGADHVEIGRLARSAE